MAIESQPCRRFRRFAFICCQSVFWAFCCIFDATIFVFQLVKGSLRPDGGDQAGNADEGDGSSNVIGERRQTELAADVLQPPHQESALVHPLFDRAERMLDTFSTLVQDFGSGGKARRHSVKHRLVLKA